MEFLTVGDYGKENNIKADFLGLTKEVNGVANTEVNLGDKLVAYDVYRQFEQPLLDEGLDVIVFVHSKEEDEDRITCGNTLLSETLKKNKII